MLFYGEFKALWYIFIEINLFRQIFQFGLFYRTIYHGSTPINFKDLAINLGIFSVLMYVKKHYKN